ncbi:HNH endonuclease [Miltoncostaea marina]|uniref:HNH endonuclease n=1 Tax=Miltoncostaea marina TaxID=2843215 RepID=UPI001C3E3CA3|nr:HNH endonuclease [Miltoncostaea marina]
MAQQVLVLNATYEPINVCSLQRAVVLVLKNKAEVLEKAARSIRSAAATHVHPLVIRLVYFVRVPRHESRRISRRAVFARDGYECQYCGVGTHLTLDHVIPRSRGGRSSWENVVTSCAPCNLRKGNRLPAEIGMHPRTKPRPPRPDVFISVAAPRQPNAWLPYLSRGGSILAAAPS